MVARPSIPAEPRRVLDLARTDRSAATRAIRELPIEAQVALVCETPLARRSELIGLLPTPEAVIPLIPEAELCFTIKAIGIGDASWLLSQSTAEQIVACLDLDVWRGTSADRAAVDEWFAVLASCEEAHFLRSVQALDPEIVVLFLKHRIQCIQKPDDDEGWQPPEGAQTIDGAFYFVALHDNDDIEPVIAMLRALFTADYWTYFRMMQGIIHELDAENEEWALRWRTGRLEDLGMPPWERAMEIYRFISPSQRSELPESAAVALDFGEWQLPVWMPGLPATPDSEHLLFRTLARLDEAERRSALFGFVALTNKIAVADRMLLSDAESTPRAIAKAARFASSGLEFIAAEIGIDPIDVIRSVTLQRLFSVGANLDPEAAKP